MTMCYTNLLFTYLLTYIAHTYVVLKKVRKADLAQLLITGYCRARLGFIAVMRVKTALFSICLRAT